MTTKKQFDLRGKNALVTGSGQGIGRVIALTLAEYGANVMIHCLHEGEHPEKVATKIKEYGVHAGIITCDLAGNTAVETISRQCQEQIGTIDILVVNASVQVRKNWMEIQEEDFDKQIKVNWWRSLELIQQMVPDMARNKWGRILTIGSVQQEKPHPQMITYAATKSALVNMVKNLALQLAKDGITVNNLAPGVILTPRNEQVLADEAYRQTVQAKIPVGFFGEAADCAALALLLCSDAGRYITGQDIFVDGGMSL
jgi:glucose 1-dehydrogenase